MIQRTPQELRRLARRFREMSTSGGDESLNVALLELADEFDWEADIAEAQPLTPPGGQT